MIPGIDPKIDFAFKRMFGGEEAKELLPHLINAVRQRISSHRVTTVQVLNPFTDKMTLDEKLAILDIKAQDETEHWYNVEMQMLAVVAVRQRFLYYWSKLYSGQLQQGDDYRELRPTISICLMDSILFRDRPDDYHTVFKLKSEDGQACLSDDLEIHVIELPKFGKSLDKLMTPLDLWLSFLKNGASLDADNLPQPLNTSPIRKAMEVLKKMSQSTIDREIYEGRVKAQRDQRAAALEIGHLQSEVGHLQSEVGHLQSEVGHWQSEANRWHNDFDAAARERDEAKQLVARQIQLFERLLQRPVSDRGALLSKSLNDLRRIAEGLESELTKRTESE